MRRYGRLAYHSRMMPVLPLSMTMHLAICIIFSCSTHHQPCSIMLSHKLYIYLFIVYFDLEASKPSVRVPANIYLEGEHKSVGHIHNYLFPCCYFIFSKVFMKQNFQIFSHITMHHFRILNKVAPHSHLPCTDAGNKKVRMGWP